jgi:glycosyltransferase involved in cell wall biosynthesis
VDGESRVILDASAAGIYYPAENAQALLDAIEKLRTNPVIAQEMGIRGRDYVTQHFSRRAQALKMLEAMKRV